MADRRHTQVRLAEPTTLNSQLQQQAQTYVGNHWCDDRQDQRHTINANQEKDIDLIKLLIYIIRV